jgi:hypothetical protein
MLTRHVSRKPRASPALRMAQRKTPAERIRRGFRFHAVIRRSGQEVLVHTDGDVPSVLRRAANRVREWSRRGTD